jgi:competence protein ComEA
VARTSLPSEPPPARTLLLAAGGAVLVALVGWWLVRPAAAPLEATLPVAGSIAADGGGSAAGLATSESPGSSTAPGPGSGQGAGDGAGDGEGGEEEEILVVQAAGAVRQPGVVRLPTGSRVDDLVRAAGGFADGADRDRVNLAALVADGERVWIPAVGEEAAPDVVAGGGGGPVGGGGSAGSVSDPAGGAKPAGPVDLNRATEVELDALPGVGPATAAAILAHREEIGRFASVEQLLDVRGIGEAKLEQLRPLVTV